MSNPKIQEAKGRVQEAAGDLTNDDDLKSKGKMNQAASSLKEKARDVVEGVEDKVDDAKDWLADKTDSK